MKTAHKSQTGRRGGSRTAPASGLAALLVGGLLFMAACGQHDVDTGSSSVSYGAAPGDEVKAELFTVPAEQQVTPVEMTRLPRVLRLTGSVAHNNFKTTPVISQISGPVSRIVVVPGEVVRTDQPMLYVSSPEYAQLRATYLKARDALALAETSYGRASDLYAHHAIAQADLQQAESTRNQAQADLQSGVIDFWTRWSGGQPTTHNPDKPLGFSHSSEAGCLRYPRRELQFPEGVYKIE